jgi:hypothetical protein
VAATASLPPVANVGAAIREKSWPDRLRKLADVSGQPVLADYYRSLPVTKPLDNRAAEAWGILREDRAPEAEEPPDPARRAAIAALDALSERDRYLWWAHGETLLLRKRDWFFQRLYEVPDRWLLATAGQLRKRNGHPTWGDLFRVLELTPEQLAGLNGMGDDHGAVFPGQGLHEIVAMARAAPYPPASPLPVRPEKPPPREAWDRLWLWAARMNPAQRLLLSALLETHPYPLSPEEAGRFRVRIWYDPDPPRAPEARLRKLGLWPPHHPGYRSAAIGIGLNLDGENRTYGREILLPLSLPNDRRSKTRVEAEGEMSNPRERPGRPG